jgi:signal transduction histidine kinase
MRLSWSLISSSVRARLLLLIFVPTAALVGLTVYYQLEQRQNQEDRAEARLIDSSALVAQNQHERFTATKAFLVQIASLPELRLAAIDPDSQAARAICQQRLEAATVSISGALGFGLVDATGRRICSSTSAERGGLSAADRLDFQVAMAQKDFAIGEIVQTRTTPTQQTMTVALPLFGANQEVVAVLRLGASLENATPLVVPAGAPAGSDLSLVDRKGLIISSSSRTPGTSIGPIGFQALQESEFLRSLLIKTVGDDGAGRRSVITRVSDGTNTPLYTVMSVPPDALSVSLIDALLPELLIVLAISAGTFAAAWFLGDVLIARRASALAESARRIRAGDFAHAGGLPEDGTELGQVGVAFNEMASQLNATMEQLRQALNAKDEFLSLVSHELRTPVTTILGNAEVLVNRWDSFEESTRLSAIQDVRVDAVRLRDIIQNLLVLARVETGKGLELEPLILRRSIQAGIDARRQHRPERAYRIELPDELVVVEGNAQCIEQIVGNLLSNAEKYSPSNTPIVVRLWRREDQLVVSVEDQGVGVEPEEIDRLFSPFYRSSRTARYSGAGLGLSVCQRLVEAQGGKVWAEPNNGRGAIFAFSLPIVEVLQEEYEPVTEEPDPTTDALIPA